MSGGALRRKVQAVLARLGLAPGCKAAFDLASFKPGGATWMLHVTGNGGLLAGGRCHDLCTKFGAYLVDTLALGDVLTTSKIPQRAWFFLIADRRDMLSHERRGL